LRFIAEGQNIQTKRLIQSVVDLFNDNWGRKDGKFIVQSKQMEDLERNSFLESAENENQPSAIPDHLQQVNYNDSPVFYGPDGKIISEEESSFLNSNMPANYPINIDDIIE